MPKLLRVCTLQIAVVSLAIFKQAWSHSDCLGVVARGLSTANNHLLCVGSSCLCCSSLCPIICDCCPVIGSISFSTPLLCYISSLQHMRAFPCLPPLYSSHLCFLNIVFENSAFTHPLPWSPATSSFQFHFRSDSSLWTRSRNGRVTPTTMVRHSAEWFHGAPDCNGRATFDPCHSRCSSQSLSSRYSRHDRLGHT